MAAIPEPTPNYAHRARYVPPAAGQRYDGDSFRLELDLGAYVGGAIRPTLEVAIRLEGIDVVERTDRRLTDYALTLLELAHRITAQTVKPDLSGELGGTFERTRAHVWIDGEDLADALRAAGYSKADPHALA
jgi:endonuclease YncB( thermonuclease family)